MAPPPVSPRAVGRRRSRAIYLVVDGELEVVRPPPPGGGRAEALGVLRAGHSVGEFGALIAARATAGAAARRFGERQR